ncbi:sugar porter family MFS transporter [Chitinophaga sp. Hz27]|uniref:sugar porter family MFS transporter n=1 Tax=Chitinophaga sp. Hz27 TaxID=3347169 RepID=UPI0035DC23C2
MNKQSAINTRYLTLITLTATLGGFLFGFDTAVISGAIPFVKSQYHMNALMEGWFVSSALLGCIAGVFVSGWLGNVLGRKKVMLLSAILFAISAAGCTFTPDATWLIIFRLIGGTGIGAASVICPMYIAELAPASLRGKMVTFYQLAITVGILAAYFSNSLIQSGADSQAISTGWLHLMFNSEVWRGMFAVGIIPAVLFLLMSVFIPESPRWLALRAQFNKAQRILARISGNEEADREMKEITTSLNESKNNQGARFNGSLKKALFIGILLAALSQFSGINAIIYYGPSILEHAGLQLGQALGGQVTIGIVNTLFTFVAIYIIDRYGRKPLLLWGIGGAVVSLLTTALLFALNIVNGWVVLLPIVIFIACFAFSFGPVTWVIINEIFPTAVRSNAIAVSTMSLWIANWLVGQFFPLCLQYAGAAVSFLGFAVFSMFAFWISWKKLPETSGKTLEEISTLMLSKD